ncbi:hypothetical protein lbkm_1032 [Lachnospiraceae bacterium KM106-2]|nr:hypothetical protein lbkm_1032 [Lachnospiraceae bacterium KM106-2]
MKKAAIIPKYYNSLLPFNLGGCTYVIEVKLAGLYLIEICFLRSIMAQTTLECIEAMDQNEIHKKTARTSDRVFAVSLYE